VLKEKPGKIIEARPCASPAQVAYLSMRWKCLLVQPQKIESALVRCPDLSVAMMHKDHVLRAAKDILVKIAKLVRIVDWVHVMILEEGTACASVHRALCRERRLVLLVK
jgi:hypothetical protein